MSFYGYPKYESVSEKKIKASRATEKLRKKDKSIEPVIVDGKVLVKSWWGKAWNVNLESYADFSNRILRGKSYVKQNAVIDLKIQKGLIKSKVMGSGSKPYEIDIHINPLTETKWLKIVELCHHRIESLEQLLEGQFPQVLEVLFKEKAYGLFPSPKEIKLSCNCPDSAYMCKHIAATLYGIGVRLDHNPILFFELRELDVQALIKKTVEEKLDSMLKNAGKKTSRSISDEKIADLFGF